MISLQDGKLTYRDNRLIIYDSNNKAYTLSLYLPKMVPDPESKKLDGLKKFPLGAGISQGNWALRVKYHTGNWIFIILTGSKPELKASFLVNEYQRLRSKKMLSHEMRLGKKDEFIELRNNLIDSYEKSKCTYSKPRVFKTDPLPYAKYYPWMKYEKVGRRKKIMKKVYVERRKSNEYFKDEAKFQAILMEIGYRADNEPPPVELDMDGVSLDDEQNLALAAGDAVIKEDHLKSKSVSKRTSVFDANNPNQSAITDARTEKTLNVPIASCILFFSIFKN